MVSLEVILSIPSIKHSYRGFYSITVHYGLVCDKSFALSSIISQQMVGLACGTVIFGPLSDIYGRKKIWLITNVAEILIGGLISVHFSPTWKHFANWRFLLGFFMGGHMVAMWTLLIESTGRKYRFNLKPMGYSFIGQIWFAFLAYQTREWRILTFIANFQAFPTLILLYYFIPESPRWLMTENFDHETSKAFTAIGNWNRRVSSFPHLPAAAEQDYPVITFSFTDTMTKIFRVLALPATTPLFVNWFMVSALTYGLAFHIAHLFGNPFLLLSTTGFFPWIGYLFALFLDRSFYTIGRKFIHCYSVIIPACLLFYIAAQLTTTTSMTLDKNLTIVALVAYSIVDCAWMTNYQLTSELYPTEIRTTATGLGSGAARLGAAVAPHVFNTGLWMPSLPYLILGVGLTFAVFLVVLFLKETKGKALPE